MEYIGIDVHQRESQVCIVDEGGQVLLSGGSARVASGSRRCSRGGGRARVLLEASTESEWVAQAPGGAGPRGDRGGPELRADVRQPQPAGEDGSAGCPDAGGRLSAGGVPPRAPDLGRAAHGAGAAGGAGGVGADADALHQRDPRGAPPRRGAGAERGRGDVRAAGAGARAVRAAGGGWSHRCSRCSGPSTSSWPSWRRSSRAGWRRTRRPGGCPRCRAWAR